MKKLLERLKEEILVCDGAMGTMLMSKGMPEGSCPDYWGIKNKKLLISIHKAYIDAGCDMIITDTFGANAIKLKRFRLQRKTKDLNKRAVEIAREAAEGKAYVLGDVGPTGEYLKPVGNVEPEEMLRVFTEQVRTLQETGVDAIILETMSDMEELKTAIMAVKENSKLPLIACMTFQRQAKKGFRTTSGISIPQFVNDSLLSGCNVIGANCSVVIGDMVDLISEMRSLSTSFLIAQPNAGTPRLIDNKTVYGQSPDEFKEFIPRLIEAGANIIGGCCGTTPEHIRKIREAISCR